MRANALDKINIGLDFFDASVNRIGAWTIGSQATLKAFLYALLEPQKTLTEYDNKGQYFERLALLEEMKNMPFDAVWNYHCYQHNIPTGITLIKEIQEYEKKVLSKRNN